MFEVGVGGSDFIGQVLLSLLLCLLLLLLLLRLLLVLLLLLLLLSRNIPSSVSFPLEALPRRPARRSPSRARRRRDVLIIPHTLYIIHYTLYIIHYTLIIYCTLLYYSHGSPSRE